MKLIFKLFFLLFIVFSYLSCGDLSEEKARGEYSGLNRDSIYYIIHELYNKQDYKGAERLIEKITPNDQLDVEYFSIKAKIKYNCLKFTEAIFAINRVLAVDTRNAGLCFLKSSCFIALNLPDSSLYYTTKAIDLDTTNEGYILSRARLYGLMKIPVLQLDDIKRLINLDSNNLQYKNNLYNFFYENGDTATAINGYKDILEKDRFNLYAMKALGFIYYKKGEKKISKLYIQKIIDVDPTDGEVFFIMASILSKEKNKKDEACDCLLKSLELGCQEAGKHIYKCDEYLRKKGVIIQADTIYNVEEKAMDVRPSTRI
jgi:tetratricopeptide (TPR) repeat protein